MAYGKKTKPEHGGPKNGGGYYGSRDDAKKTSKRVRRQADKKAVKEGLDTRRRRGPPKPTWPGKTPCGCAGCPKCFSHAGDPSHPAYANQTACFFCGWPGNYK